MPVEIFIDPREIEDAMERLRDVPYAFSRAIYPAVTEVGEGVKKRILEYLSSNVPVSSKARKRAVKMNISQMADNSVTAQVVVHSNKAIPLIDYDALPQDITSRHGIGVRDRQDFSYALRYGSRRMGRSRIEGASLPFIQRMPKSGHLGVFYRTGLGRSKEEPHYLKIRQSYGPSVEYHVATPEVEGYFIEEVDTRFPMILARYVEQALANHGGDK